MLWYTESKTSNKIAINPEHVVAVFSANEGDFNGKTIIGLINGQVAVEEPILEVVGQLV